MKTVVNFSGNESKTELYFAKANFDENFYVERTNRNIGWISEDEQKILLKSCVAVAGCGGMGGLLASILVRLGVGALKIADSEEFDVSNINRQYGALKSTIGRSKALTTAKALREITDDFDLTVFPEGVTRDSCVEFVKGNDLICDEIEFWAIGSKILLHQEARRNGIPIISCNTAGHQANLTYFSIESKIEETLGYSLDEALAIQTRIQKNLIKKEELIEESEKIVKTFIPKKPIYNNDSKHNITESVISRLQNKGTASIIATNPSFACGFLANHVLFQLLKKSNINRNIVYPPRFPGYLSMDSGLVISKVVH